MGATPSNERLLLLVNGTPLAGSPRSGLRDLPYLASLAQRGVNARLKMAARGMPVWTAFATGAPQATGPLDEKMTFWHLLADKGKQVVTRNPMEDAREALTLAAHENWHFMMLVYPSIAAEAGKETFSRWQEWDKAIAGIGMAAGAQTAVMVVGLPTATDPGVLVAGGGFIAQLGDVGTMDLLDLAPTILWLLDVPPPRQMTGRVWDELWRPEAGWSDAEQEALLQHLRGLGYLS